MHNYAETFEHNHGYSFSQNICPVVFKFLKAIQKSPYLVIYKAW